MTLNRKMVEIDNATSSSSALIIGEAAAIADPRKSQSRNQQESSVDETI